MVKTDNEPKRGTSEREALLVESYPREKSLTRGPELRFNENIDSNIKLLKKWLPTDRLILREYEVGSLSRTKVILAYLKGKANSDIVMEIEQRIKKIKAEIVLDSSYIERNIEDSNISPFPQVEISKKPEVAASALCQGRVLVLVDGSSDVLLAPATFFDLMDTPQDAFSRWFIGAVFFRIARYIMFIFAASLPGFYIALTSANPSLLPSELIALVVGSQEQAAFPVYFEAFLMMGVVEAVRLMIMTTPGQVGTTVALFAGIVLVGAGLSAHIITVPVTMIVTLTIISSFAIPNYDLRTAIRIIQFFTMIMSSLFGLFGYAVSFFYIANNLVTLKSFGIPFMAPLAPAEGSGWMHTILRNAARTMPQDQTYQPQSIETWAERRGDSDG